MGCKGIACGSVGLAEDMFQWTTVNRGSVVVKALCCKPEGRGFKFRLSL
jgi:hypothetical protein